MQSRATVSFVSKAILSSSDGIRHDEVTRIEGTETQGGLQVRKPLNRDLEKLRQRQEGAAGGADLSGDQSITGNLDGTNLTLFEQLQQNKEDKEEEYEAQLRESRMPKALDEDEVAFLEEQEQRKLQELEAHVKQEQQDLAEFRAARQSFKAPVSEITATRMDGTDAQSSFFGKTSRVVNVTAQRSRMPNILLKKRRRTDLEDHCSNRSIEDAGAQGIAASVKPGEVDTSSKANKRPKSSSPNPLSNSSGIIPSRAVQSLASYASSSDSEEDS